MNHKKYQAIEVVKNCDTTSDLVLCGTEELHKTTLSIAKDIYYKNIDNKNLFCNFFGTNTNKNFFYNVISYIDNQISKIETGLGCIYSKENIYYLQRLYPYSRGKSVENLVKIDPQSKYICEGITIAVASNPNKLSDLFLEKNAIICSQSDKIPISIGVDSFSLLGRLDNDLNSISITDPLLIEQICKGICNYNKQLSLKSSKLDAKTLSTSALQLKPSVNNNAKKGTFIYDEITDSVKFYNGNKWRTLKWEENENQE